MSTLTATVRPGLSPGQLLEAAGVAPVGADLTLREGPIKIGTKVVHHAPSVTFQLAEMVVPVLFATILARTGRLRVAPSPE